MVEPENVRLLQRRLADLHEQRRSFPPADQMSMLLDTRELRLKLDREISRTERLATEAWRLLALELPPGFGGPGEDSEVVVSAWLRELDGDRTP
jgi:hypothetical protein